MPVPPALTRIRNNQVYNSDIYADAKIVPQSISGGLWNPQLNFTGNLTVGNLFVNGNTTSLDTISIVSADPVIVLNRNFSGANTYDVGFILGRGSQTNTTFAWNESNKEFAFFYTSATTNDSYYGTIPNSGYANLQAYGGKFNNVTVDTATITNFDSPNLRISGAYLDNVVIGANVPNSAIFSNVIASNGLSLNANATLFSNSATAYVFNSGVTTINIGNAAAAMYIGGPGTSNSITLSSRIINGNTTVDLFNTSGVINFGTTASGITVGSTSGTTTVQSTANAASSTSGALVVKGGLAVAKAVNIGEDLIVGGNLLVRGNTTTFGSNNFTVLDHLVELHTYANLDPLTFNDGNDIGIRVHYYDTADKAAFFGRANDTGFFEYYADGTELAGVFSGTYGGIRGGRLVISNTDASTTTTTGVIIANGGVGIAGATNIGGGLNLQGNAYITTNQTTATLLDATATTVNAFADATTVNIGNATGTATIRNATLVGTGQDQNLYTTTPNITIGATSGNITVRNEYFVVDKNTLFNQAGGEYNFVVQGNIAAGFDNLLVANGSTGQVGIKLTADSIPENISFMIDAKDSWMPPKGYTGERPPGGSEVPGMFRYNTSLNVMEFWDGTGWNTGGATFTTIVSDQFTGDGSQVNFTLSQSSTTAGCLVSINGIIQLPLIAYSVLGTTLTFTEAPLSTDVIDIRTITTTGSVTEIAEGTSKVAISNLNAFTTTVIRGATNFYGNLYSNYFGKGISSLAANTSLTQDTPTTVDTFDKTKFRTAKYIASVSDFATGKYQTSEVLVIHNGTYANVTEYATLTTAGSPFVDFTATIASGNVNLQANSSSSASYCNVQMIYVTP